MIGRTRWDLTRIWEGVLDDVQAMVRTKPPGTLIEVFILSDGLDNETKENMAGPGGARALLKRLHELGIASVVFNIVGIGELPQEVSQTFEQVSGLTGGLSFSIPSVSGIDQFKERFITPLVQEAGSIKEKIVRVRERAKKARAESSISVEEFDLPMEAQVRIYDRDTSGFISWWMKLITAATVLSDSQDEEFRRFLTEKYLMWNL